MFKVEAIIQVSRVAQVKDALVARGVDDIVIADVRGCGASDVQHAIYRGVRYPIAFAQRASVVVIADDAEVDNIIDTILAAARSGQPGDGNIFVTPVAAVIEIDAAPPTPVGPPEPQTAAPRRPLLEWAETTAEWRND